MFLFNIQTKNGEIIRFERNITNNKIEANSMIKFIKEMKETFNCGLKDAKDFCYMIVQEMDKLDASPDALKNQIRNSLFDVNNTEDLIDILRFVRTVIDHPKPLGSFTENGDYIPNARL